MRYESWMGCAALALLLPAFLLGCQAAEAEKPVATDPVYHLAGGCYAVAGDGGRYLQVDRSTYGFSAAGLDEAEPLRLQPSGLGEYLLYDRTGHYLAAKKRGSGGWGRLRTKRAEDVHIGPDAEFSDAEWAIVTPKGKTDRYWLRHVNSGAYLGAGGLGDQDEAALITLAERQDCSIYPELSLDAHGTIRKKPWADGDVYGVADAHSHLFTNFAFGGGGVFHGAPFHRLGVEHALGDCDEVHGPSGTRDIIGYFYSDRGLDPAEVPRILVTGSVGDFNHANDGYPTFSAWPNLREHPTHQGQYYRWLERAYLGGLRLVFQHATGNSALCEIVVGIGAQEAPYGCNDMVSVDKQIDAAYAMERYIDAQSGGPGRGWFRVVTTPEAARAEINRGKLAIVLGIEISNLFDCFLTPPPGMPACTVEHVKAQVKRYYDKGVRVVFPVHKFDNGFSPGDGHRGVIEVGNFVNSGHYSDYTLDCPDDIKPSFDKGNVTFGGLNKPRDEYFSRAPANMSTFVDDPVFTMLPVLPDLAEGPLKGDYCQKFGLTDLGRVLLDELMGYGMMIDVAHLPQWSVAETLEILDRRRYPAISTHGAKFDGKIYRHGGTGDTNLDRCGDPARPGRMAATFIEKAAEIKAANGLPAQPLAFDLNGFAGNPGPRFGPKGCGSPQANPITYPFESYDGGVTFEQPMLGERVVDFNQTGMIHIGLLPEYIEDVRRDGASDEALEPLFRTAETLIRVWEAAEAAAK